MSTQAYKPWTPDQDEAVRKHWPDDTLSIDMIGALIGRSGSATYTRAREVLGLPARARYVPPTGWTEERKTAALEMWKSGHSATHIANQLGGTTRGAVIGIIHRAGQSERVKPSVPARLAKPIKPPKPPPSNADHAWRPKAKTPKPAGVMVLPPQKGGDAATAARVENIAARANPPENVQQMARAFTPLPGCTPVPFGSKGCRWPVGGEGAEMVACGQPRADGEESYCAAHAKASRPPPAAKANLDRYLGIPKQRAA